MFVGGFVCLDDAHVGLSATVLAHTHTSGTAHRRSILHHRPIDIERVAGNQVVMERNTCVPITPTGNHMRSNELVVDQEVVSIADRDNPQGVVPTFQDCKMGCEWLDERTARCSTFFNRIFAAICILESNGAVLRRPHKNPVGTCTTAGPSHPYLKILIFILGLCEIGL